MLSQSLSISATQTPIALAFSMISQIEIEFLRTTLPDNFIIQDHLSHKTSYLVMYRTFFTDKYITARNWGIPVINISWLYDFTENPKKKNISNFENCLFISIGQVNQSTINFYELQGGTFTTTLKMSTDFIIAESSIKKSYLLYDKLKDKENNNVNCGNDERLESYIDKTLQNIFDYSIKNQIPIIFEDEIYTKNFSFYKKPYNYIITNTKEEEIFDELNFFIDPKMNEILYNYLKRTIIKNEGYRSSDFMDPYNNQIKISNNEDDFLFYQYIFDCEENKRQISKDFYIIKKKKNFKVFNGLIFYIDFDSINKNNHIKVKKQIEALGGIIKKNVVGTCTHILSNNYTKSTKLKTVVDERWLENCLSNLYISAVNKKLPIKENIKKRKVEVTYSVDKEILIQFSALSEDLLIKAKIKLEDLEIKFLENNLLHEDCTHLIMDKLALSEKLLVAILQGVKIISADFITSDSPSLNKFIFKEDKNESEIYNKKIRSINRWQNYIKTKNKKIFGNWVCRIDDEAMKRVLITGGAKITQNDDYTHYFYNKNDNIKGIDSKKVYPKSYIARYLLLYDK